MIGLVSDIIGQRATTLLNEALDENPTCRATLAVLGENTIACHLTLNSTLNQPGSAHPLLDQIIPDTLATVLLTLQSGEVVLQAVSNTELPTLQADISVHGTPLALGQWFWGNSSEIPAAITIEGNNLRLLKILQALRQLDIDWGAEFADQVDAISKNTIGDIPTHLFAQGFSASQTWLKDSAQRLNESCANYRDEEQVGAARPLDTFSHLLGKFESLLKPSSPT